MKRGNLTILWCQINLASDLFASLSLHPRMCSPSTHPVQWARDKIIKSKNSAHFSPQVLSAFTWSSILYLINKFVIKDSVLPLLGELTFFLK